MSERDAHVEEKGGAVALPEQGDTWGLVVKPDGSVRPTTPHEDDVANGVRAPLDPSTCQPTRTGDDDVNEPPSIEPAAPVVPAPAPFYEDDHVVLYHGDFREVLPSIDTSGVGLALVDPPYGETSLQWDRWPFGWASFLAEHLPVTAPMWCFGSLRMFMDHAVEFGAWTFSQDVVMEKHNGSSSAADRFRKVHELVALYYRGPWADIYRNPVTTNDATARQVRRKQKPAHWGDIGGHSYESVDGGPRLARSVLYVRTPHGSAIHPTQKAAEILHPLLTYSLAPGGLVLDPMAGSGSTLRTAKDGGWRAIGIEAREDYCERAALHLSQGVLSLA